MVNAEKYPTIDLWNAEFEKIDLDHDGEITI